MFRARSMLLLAVALILGACTTPAPAVLTPVPAATVVAPAATPAPAAPTAAATTAVAATAAPTTSAPAATAVPTTSAPAATPGRVLTPRVLPTVAPVVLPPLARILALQSPALRGEDVRLVQQRLLDLGYTQVGRTDGVYGANTAAAVRAFQTLSIINDDGVVGENTWRELGRADAPIYDLHPIVDPLYGMLIGASNNGVWYDAVNVAPIVAAQQYRLLDAVQTDGASNRPVEIAVAGAAALLEGEVPCEWLRNVVIELPANVTARVAIAADWSTQPRPVTAVDAAETALVAPLMLTLQALGLATPTINVTRALRADLDGDGSEETIIAATYRDAGGDGPAPSAAAGDYSLIAVLPAGAPVASVIVSDVVLQPIEFGAPYQFDLLGLYDLNGDGTLEMVLESSYYEGASMEVYRVAGIASKRVLTEGCGV